MRKVSQTSAGLLGSAVPVNNGAGGALNPIR
jgi:hypothetical protein